MVDWLKIRARRRDRRPNRETTSANFRCGAKSAWIQAVFRPGVNPRGAPSEVRLARSAASKNPSASLNKSPSYTGITLTYTQGSSDFG